MIVARGLGVGAVGAIVASGLCLSINVSYTWLGGTVLGLPAQPEAVLVRVVSADDRDLLEIIPAFVEIINARRS